MSAPNTNPDWQHKWTFALIALALIIVGVLCAFAIFRSNPPAEPEKISQDPPPIPPPTTLAAKIIPATIAATRASSPATSLAPSALAAAIAKSPEASAVYAAASPALVRITTIGPDKKPLALGSGFFISANGLLATNFHVVKGAVSATIIFGDESKIEAAGFIALDETNDLIILSVAKEKLPFLPLENLPTPNIGDRVYALGNPEGLTNTFSEGIISSLRKDAAGETFAIQTTAPISHGSSGGALLSSTGKLLGVTTGTKSDGQNLNFAIPAAKLAALLKSKTDLAPLSSLSTKNRDRDAVKLLSLGDQDIADKNFSAALTKFRSAILLKPDFPEAYLRIGNIYAVQKQYTDSLAAYDAAIKLNPNFAWAHYSKGTILAQTGKQSAAISSLTKAAELDPAGEAGKLAKEMLEKSK